MDPVHSEPIPHSYGSPDPEKPKSLKVEYAYFFFGAGNVLSHSGEFELRSHKFLPAAATPADLPISKKTLKQPGQMDIHT